MEWFCKEYLTKTHVIEGFVEVVSHIWRDGVGDKDGEVPGGVGASEAGGQDQGSHAVAVVGRQCHPGLHRQ